MSKIQMNDLVKPREITHEPVLFKIGIVIRAPYESQLKFTETTIMISYRVDVLADGKIYEAVLVSDLEKI